MSRSRRLADRRRRQPFITSHHTDFATLEPRRLMAAAPVVIDFVGDNRGRAEFDVSKPLQPATVNSTSVKLILAGFDLEIGTADDAAAEATVDLINEGKTIRVQTELAAWQPYRVVLDGSKIKATDGILLDGDFAAGTRSGDGTPGGNFDAIFEDPGYTLVRFITDAGDIYVEMFDDDAPQTVENFLNYADAGDYDQTIIHRSIPGFIVQGGGFRSANNGASVQHIEEGAPVANEFKRSNLRGTIAMAKLPPEAPGGGPNSATSEWFFNLANNSTNLDNQNGGFTVFGQVDSAKGLQVMDALAQYPRRENDASGLDDLPVLDSAAAAAPTINYQDDTVFVYRVAAVMEARPFEALRVGATADFNGDGITDLVVRDYATGENTLWRVTPGSTTPTKVPLPTLANLAWELVGAGDFDADGDNDLVWRNRDTGNNTTWLMNGQSIQAFKALPPVYNFNWSVATVADFNADGKKDLVWRNAADGRNSLWLMNGNKVQQFRALPPVKATTTQLGAAGDFTGDGKTDIVWRDTLTGRNTLWQMNGNQIAGYKQLPVRQGNAWRLVNAGQLDGQTGNDLLWYNVDTAQLETWTLNNGTFVAAVPLPKLSESGVN